MATPPGPAMMLTSEQVNYDESAFSSVEISEFSLSILASDSEFKSSTSHQ